MEKLLISTEHDFANFGRFMHKAPEAMVYHTREYVDLVADHLGAESFYLGLKENDRLIGAIPLVLKRNTNLGSIINSNPYYGSYGGLIVDPDLPPMKKAEAKRKLMEFFNEFAMEHDCILSTIIASPFDRDQMFYFDNLKFNYRDWRVAQVTLIPSPSKKSLEDRLFYERFSSSCRRAIRKAEKAGINIGETSEKGHALDEFYEIYRENMESMGASVKDKRFFEKALETFPERGCTLRYAELDEKIVGGVFHFYYKDIIEDFQPAIGHDYRTTGANNLLVYHGMEQGTRDGYLYWNFGGTWKTLEDLYHFKRSFGAIDFVYYYFITAHADDTHIKELESADLEREYPGFYVMPYSELFRHGKP